MSSNVAIKIENLSKKFRIAGAQEKYTTMRDQLTELATGFGRRLAGKPSLHPATKEFWALKDLSLDVGRGEVIGIVGRNGAGKSTLLKVLSRITEPTEGMVTLRGRVSSLLEVGSGFHPELSGRDNIYMNGAILGMKKQEIDRKFDEIVDFAETGQFIDTIIKHYSSGMYMRLAFAVAAYLEAEILFVDEVLAVGDAAFQKKCLGRMQNIANEGRTVIFVSHNLTAIATLCQKTLHLEGGRMVAYGPTDEVVAHYLIPDAERCLFDPLQFPDEERLKLHGARITQDGAAQGAFLTSRPIEVEIDYELKQDIVGFRAGIDVITHDGIVLWRSWDDDLAGLGAVRRTKGRYIATCTIPADIFFARNYIVSLSLGIHHVGWISYGTVQQGIQLHNAHGVGWAYADERYRAGALMLGLPWTTNRK